MNTTPQDTPRPSPKARRSATKRERREAVVAIRLTLEELDRIERAAAGASVSRSQFMRASLLRGPLKVEPIARPATDAAMVVKWRELSRLGSNLNQLVRLTHEGRSTAIEASELRVILDQIARHLEAMP